MSLSVTQALAVLDGIDKSMTAFERTAPAAFQAFGGRDELLAISQPTCVGPMPRFTTEEWAPFAGEYAVLQADKASSRNYRVGPGVGVNAGQEPGVGVHPSRHAGPMFSRS